MNAIQIVAIVVRELALFAAAGFLIGGLDDLVVDLVWLIRSGWRRLTVYNHHPRATAATLPLPRPGRLALFVPAWHEDAVIGAMIATALARLRHRDWRLYVGTYPNDDATIAAVREAARGDPRVRLVVGDRPGPTTKAGCLNWLWQAMRADEARDGVHVKGVVLHDAEDMVHRDELAVYDALVDRFDMVQLPVVAEPVRGRGWWAAFLSSVYSGEFAEAHAKAIVVREAIGAAVPSAGVGCAIGRAALDRAAVGREGPFDPSSLTEDYEIGLRIAARGGRAAFVRIASADGQDMVAVHACFPHGFTAAARQKARWITGISLAGWDRLGWAGGLAERWMRLRDRRTPLAALVLGCAYVALIGWAIVLAAGWLHGEPIVFDLPGLLILTNCGLLGWRIAMRAMLTARQHGPALALLTPFHMIVGNLIAMCASVRALGLYAGIVRTGRVRWDKTAHVFPVAG